MFSKPTHKNGHILDWVVSRSDIPAFVHSMSVEDLLLSDHFLVRLKTNMKRPVAGRKKIKTRNLKNIDMYSFRESLAKSDLVKTQSSDPEKLVLLYSQTLSTLLDDYASMKEKLVSDRPDSYWCSQNRYRTERAIAFFSLSGSNTDAILLKPSISRCAIYSCLFPSHFSSNLKVLASQLINQSSSFKSSVRHRASTMLNHSFRS